MVLNRLFCVMDCLIFMVFCFDIVCCILIVMLWLVFLVLFCSCMVRFWYSLVSVVVKLFRLGMILEVLLVSSVI